MRSLLALLIGTSLAGCFNPDLGPNPFLCASTGDKKCPDGYTCQTRGSAQVCVQEAASDAGGVTVDKRILSDAELMPSKEGPVYLDGALVRPSAGCLDESSEPNNSAAAATLIATPGTFTNWEICYPGDVDQYKIPLKIGDKLTVKIKFLNSSGDLDAALVDPAGNLVSASRGTGNEETVSLFHADKDGSFFLGVYGFGPATNKYDLDVTVSSF